MVLTGPRVDINETRVVLTDVDGCDLRICQFVLVRVQVLLFLKAFEVVGFNIFLALLSATLST